MKREKAIEILKGAIKKPNSKDGYIGQALTMAIKALEQESITWIVGKDNCQVSVRNMPTDKMQKICAVIGEEEQQPCEDCISREEAIRIAEQGQIQGFEWQFKKLCTLPSVTPSRPKGRWISHIEHCEDLRMKPSGLGAYEWCSNCDCGVDVKEFHKNHYNFCPNCGADMRGDTDAK